MSLGHRMFQQHLATLRYVLEQIPGKNVQIKLDALALNVFFLHKLITETHL